jgi:hypothetical protein
MVLCSKQPIGMREERDVTGAKQPDTASDICKNSLFRDDFQYLRAETSSNLPGNRIPCCASRAKSFR